MRVASVGDSLSSHERSWVRRACAELDLPFVAATARPGQTVADVRGQLDAALAARPDVVVVLAGTNDFVHRRVLRPLGGLNAIWGRVRRAGGVPVAATVPPHDDLPAALILARAILNGGIRVSARVRRIDLVDLSAPLGSRRGWNPAYSDDRRHPNSDGIDAMAHALVPVLGELAARSRRSG